jgi:hypothetical protein
VENCLETKHGLDATKPEEVPKTIATRRKRETNIIAMFSPHPLYEWKKISSLLSVAGLNQRGQSMKG